MVNRTEVDSINITDTSIIVKFKDGKIGEEPFSNYPGLAEASSDERQDYTVSFFGLHWPLLDEDLSFEGFYK